MVHLLYTLFNTYVRCNPQLLFTLFNNHSPPKHAILVAKLKYFALFSSLICIFQNFFVPLQPKSLCAYMHPREHPRTAYTAHIYVRNTNAMPNMQLQTLPIGEQSFEKLRTRNRLYVDKTEYIYKMIQDGTCYFLSRPRRFGKSLLLNTIEAYFLGKRELFEGLYIATQEQNWAVHPVMHLDFNAQNYDSEQKLNSFLNSFLCRQEDIYGANPNDVDLGVRFEGVIRRAYEKTGRGVVILVDEYDKPLLQAINNSALQDQYRGIMRGFFGVLKSMDKYIRFSFLTGITKFSKISIFSDLNNLRDISCKESFACVCGLTDEEVDRDLSPYIQRFAEKKDKSYDVVRADLQRKYDGYHFVDKTPGLYNPYSVMNALSKKKMDKYWFMSGTPTMLVEQLKAKRYSLPKIEEEPVSAMSLDNKTGSSDNIVPLLYQSGYLSIKNMSEDGNYYWLEFPNDEVKDGFFQFLLPYYTTLPESTSAFEAGKFVEDMREGRMVQMMQRLESFYASISYKLEIGSESDFRNAMYIMYMLMGEQVEAEYDTSDGRIDLLVRTERFVYIIECKINSTAKVALQQIHDKEYDLPWRIENREKVLIGLNFSTEKRRPDDWIVERGDGSIVSSSTQVSTQPSTQVSTQPSAQVRKLMICIGNGTYTTKELQDRLGIRTREYVRKNMLKPALADEYIAMSIPETPNDPNQAYSLTPKGLAKLEELKR